MLLRRAPPTLKPWAPFPNIPMIVSGGVNQQTASELTLAGATALGIGGELIPRTATDRSSLEYRARLQRDGRAVNQPTVVAAEEKDHPRDFLRLGPLAVIRAGDGFAVRLRIDNARQNRVRPHPCPAQIRRHGIDHRHVRRLRHGVFSGDNRSNQPAYRWLIRDIDVGPFEPRQIRSSRLAERIEFALLPVANDREAALFKKRDGYRTAQCSL
jgi:hypothetical protein